MRDVILREHRLTSCAYLELLNKLTRAQGETTVMYCARLKSLLSMYVESRKVSSTFDDMMSLIVCDRIKSTKSENCLRYVLSVEASTKAGWLQARELAKLLNVALTSVESTVQYSVMSLLLIIYLILLSHFNECMDVADEENVCLSCDNDNSVVSDDICYVSDYIDYRDFVSLQYVYVRIDELNSGKESGDMACIKAIENSGSELCVIKASLVASASLPKIGTVNSSELSRLP